ncbi:transcription factor ACEII [Fusarium heterosporum]|uniref:Transcription factor ACEII n=1 Tax=Fusarium heterosporum TaxID=42747 RepID=A0A8H5WPA9_FUSHE|nr:transcription factor ACEII [Fusarium heterosporum]
MMTPPTLVDETVLTPPTQAHVTETSKLTEMMAALDRLQESWPKSEREHLSVKELNECLRASKFDLGSYLEALLQRAQELVHLYPEVLERLEPRDSTCATPECIHNSYQYSRSESRPVIDQSLINLLLACHIRILDLFDHIIFHGHMCASAVPFLPKDHEPQLDIPEIKIGSFVAPKISAASMMIAMFIELQSSLNAKVQQLHNTVSSAVGHESREARILELQCESLEERASENVPSLQSLRDIFSKLGLIG